MKYNNVFFKGQAYLQCSDGVVQSSVPSISVRWLTAACNSSCRRSGALFWPPRAPVHIRTHRYIYAQHLKMKEVFTQRPHLALIPLPCLCLMAVVNHTPTDARCHSNSAMTPANVGLKP